MEYLALHGIAAVLSVMGAWWLRRWLLLSWWAVVVTLYERRRTGTWPPTSSVLRHVAELARLTWPIGRRRPAPEVAITRRGSPDVDPPSDQACRNGEGDGDG